MTYRALKLQFSLDNDHLEALKDELLYAHPHVVDDDGRGLVWAGEAHPTPTPGFPPATDQERAHCRLGLGTLYRQLGRREEAKAALALVDAVTSHFHGQRPDVSWI